MSCYESFLNKDLGYIFDDLDEVVWSMNLIEDQLVFISKSCEKIYGYSQEEFFHNTALASMCIHPDDQKFISEQKKYLYKGLKQDYDYRIITKNGEIKWVNSKIVPVKDQEGTIIRLSGIIKDITMKKVIQVELERKEYLLNAFSEVTKMLLSSENLDQAIQDALEVIGVTTEVDSACVFQFETTSNEVAAHLRGGWWSGYNDSTSIQSGIISFTKLTFRNTFEKLKRGLIVKGKVCEITPDLPLNPLFKNVQYLTWIPIFLREELWGFMGFQVKHKNHVLSGLDLTILSTIAVSIGGAVRRNEIEEELTRQSSYDGLTQIPNRRCFDQFLTEELEKAFVNPKPMSLILLDVDNFKLFNDNYGHQQGDECLKKIAKTISQIIHKAKDLPARYGGEEFAIVLTDTDLDIAVEIAETIRKRIEDLNILHEFSTVKKCVTVSCGVSSIVEFKNYPFKELIKNADMALYLSKKCGRNRVKSFKEVDTV